MRNLMPMILSVVCVVVVAWAAPQRTNVIQKQDVAVDCDTRKPMSEDRSRTIGDRMRRFLAPRRGEQGEDSENGIGKYGVTENALPNPVPQTFQQPASQESAYLKEIASVLSIPVSDKDTPGDIAFKIRRRIENTERYRGTVLSDESFRKAKSAIRIPADEETFVEYHKFIKKIEGKNLLICDESKEK